EPPRRTRVGIRADRGRGLRAVAARVAFDDDVETGRRLTRDVDDVRWCRRRAPLASLADAQRGDDAVPAQRAIDRPLDRPRGDDPDRRTGLLARRGQLQAVELEVAAVVAVRLTRPE